jgi:cobalt-zinc-cadmium efflux system protein
LIPSDQIKVVIAEAGAIRETVNSRHPLAADGKRLRTVLAVTAGYFVIELVAGYFANSLALMTDAVHLLTDIAALCLSLFTLWIAAKPAQGARTYGYLRAEILGALVNGVMLWVLVIFVWIEAAGRLRHPEPVKGLTVMAVAVIGVVINAFSAWMTMGGGDDGHGHHHGGMAQHAVFLHVLSDLVSSIGVLIAGAVTWLTGWGVADPAVSIVIGGLIIYGSWGLVRESVDILLESVPPHMDLDEVRDGLMAVTGTTEVHDLHVWCLASRQYALSAHAVVAPEADHDRVLGEMADVLERKFKIQHMTVQLEGDSRKEREPGHF